MIDDWMRVVELAITIEEFHRLPRNRFYKYEYFDNRAYLSPRPKCHHALLKLEGFAPTIPLEQDGHWGTPQVVPLEPESIDRAALARSFAFGFNQVQPFASLKGDEERTEAARDCLDATLAGKDGPLVRPACFLAVVPPKEQGGTADADPGAAAADLKAADAAAEPAAADADVTDARAADAAAGGREAARAAADDEAERATGDATASGAATAEEDAEEDVGDRIVGAIVVTLTPGGDPASYGAYQWRGQAPADAVEQALGRPHLTWVWSNPWLERTGVASALLAASAAVLRDMGYGELVTTFLHGNDRSMLWHWRNGFELLPGPFSFRRVRL